MNSTEKTFLFETLEALLNKSKIGKENYSVTEEMIIKEYVIFYQDCIDNDYF